MRKLTRELLSAPGCRQHSFYRSLASLPASASNPPISRALGRAATGKSGRARSQPTPNAPPAVPSQGGGLDSGLRPRRSGRRQRMSESGAAGPSGRNNEETMRKRGCAGVLQGAGLSRPPNTQARGRSPGTPVPRAASSPPRPPGPRRYRGRNSSRLGPGPPRLKTALTCRSRRREGEGSGGCLRPGHFDQRKPIAPPCPPTERAPGRESRPVARQSPLKKARLRMSCPTPQSSSDKAPGSTFCPNRRTLASNED